MLRKRFLPGLVFVLAAFLSVVGARAAVDMVEALSAEAVEGRLAEGGLDWANVETDGLQVVIEGQAPDEAARFDAMSAAAEVVEASRVIDSMTVRPSDAVEAPDFAIEILRNDGGITLIGLVPAATDRADLSGRIEDIAGGQEVVDLMDGADYPAPDGWKPALDYALEALEALPRSKISVRAERVAITAIAEDATAQRRLETELARAAPDEVRLALEISAPRPVVTPYTLRFALTDGTARFHACTADSEETRDRILEAAVAAGLEGQVACTLGLGVPARSWGEAVALSIAAVDELGGGTVTFSDADVVLTAARGTSPALFSRVTGELENALPGAFALEAVLPVDPGETAPEGPPEFTATLSAEGQAQVRGPVVDALMNETVGTFARARFGAGSVTMGTRVAPEALPQGWAIRVLAGLDSLSRLAHGSVLVTPEIVQVRGVTGNAQASDEISQLLIERIGQSADFEVDVAYSEELDPLAGLPTPEECLSQIRAVTDVRKITFDPGSAVLTAETGEVVDQIADILRNCPDLALEIAGYTDSQGRDSMNLELSQDRAEAVLSAVQGRRVPVAGFTAQGYGEEDPIADNDTADGREANRRIEFRLIADEPGDEEASDGAEDKDADGGDAADATGGSEGDATDGPDGGAD